MKRWLLKLEAAYLAWQLRRLEVVRRRTLAEFMAAVDEGRRGAQDLFFQRGAYVAERKATLEAQLRTVKKEIA
ncbi:hypothetical protein FHW83_004708 [Duganella sp. SG902]|uniref:hypothetical protein n=1 Tax=Duganella sp. SG902 TaxID=2587016 RepID=UPI00159EB2E5|nr:hypothetical protein [Duganella sp. SG902]NVM78877.1 hypothetical protein [Duganella sp. SG902]